MIGLNSYTFKSIIKELHKIKVNVSVPRAAIVTEAEILLYGDPVDFVNGEAVQSTALERTACILPLSKVIDIFHNDYSISVTDRSDLLKIMKKLSDLLNRLEHSINQRDDGVYEYISEFYESLLSQNRKKIEARAIMDKPKVMGLSGTIKTNYAGLAKSHHIDLTDILVN